MIPRRLFSIRGKEPIILRCLHTTSGRYTTSSPSGKDNFGINPEIVSNTPLSEPLPGLPEAVYATVGSDSCDTKVTTLENGLRVASENRFGKFCTVGVVIDSGSRYEVAYPSGISHFLEKMAYTSTRHFATRDTIMQELEKHGGICDCQSSRDTFIYATSVENTGLEAAVKILGDVVLRPQLSNEELEDARVAITYELEDLNMRPEQEPILVEMIHAAAYRDNTLGLPKICPAENINKIDRSMLFTFLKNHYTPKRMVLAGVGVEHEALLELAQKYFVDEKPSWIEDSSLVLPGKNLEADTSIAQYTGGLVQVEKDLSDVSLGPSPMPELAHLVLGMESCSHQDPDFVAFCVLNMLMGGGGSFSAGGPGKGMYTRLYTNVLNRYHWMHNATAYNHAYADTGVFCIHASAHPQQLRNLTDIVVREFVGMAGAAGRTELDRAKKQLQSMLLMNLESRPVVFEDIGRQVLATGHRKQPEEFIEQIDAIRAEDIQRIAGRMTKAKPAIAALGDLKKLPSYSEIEGALLNGETKLSRRGRFSLFH